MPCIVFHIYFAGKDELLHRVVSSETYDIGHNITAYSFPFDVCAIYLCFFVLYKVFIKMLECELCEFYGSDLMALFYLSVFVLLLCLWCLCFGVEVSGNPKLHALGTDLQYRIINQISL